MMPTFYDFPPVAYQSLKSGFNSDFVPLTAVLPKGAVVTVAAIMAVVIVVSLYFLFFVWIEYLNALFVYFG